MLFIVLILGFDDTLGIIEMLANGLIMLAGLIMPFAFIGMFFLPILASKHTEALKSENKF